MFTKLDRFPAKRKGNVTSNIDCYTPKSELSNICMAKIVDPWLEPSVGSLEGSRFMPSVDNDVFTNLSMFRKDSPANGSLYIVNDESLSTRPSSPRFSWGTSARFGKDEVEQKSPEKVLNLNSPRDRNRQKFFSKPVNDPIHKKKIKKPRPKPEPPVIPEAIPHCGRNEIRLGVQQLKGLLP